MTPQEFQARCLALLADSATLVFPAGPPGPPGPRGDTGPAGPPGTGAPTATPPTVPPVVTPPVGGTHLGIWIDGDVLRNKANVAQGPFCSVEAMLYSLADVTRAVAQAKQVNATAIGPLLDTGLENVAGVRAVLDQTMAAGLICWLNFDHAGELWRDPSVRAAVNDPKYSHVGLEIAVELGSGMSSSAWRTQAIAFGKEMSAAFPDRPFRIGLPDGGRNPEPAMQFGAEVLAAIGHRAGCWFAPQMYWSKTTGWYQSLGGFPSGLAGSLAAVATLAAIPGVLWGVGSDFVDDIGLTGQKEILAAARAAGMPAQSWVLSGDSMGNNLFSSATVLTQAGLEVQAAFALFPRITL